jgi:hypothetical protein
MHKKAAASHEPSHRQQLCVVFALEHHQWDANWIRNQFKRLESHLFFLDTFPQILLSLGISSGRANSSFLALLNAE